MRTNLVPRPAAHADSHIRRDFTVPATNQINTLLGELLLLVLVLGLLVPVSR
jgi:hypothetical protein